jgi:hypothetical protein
LTTAQGFKNQTGLKNFPENHENRKMIGLLFKTQNPNFIDETPLTN